MGRKECCRACFLVVLLLLFSFFLPFKENADATLPPFEHDREPWSAHTNPKIDVDGDLSDWDAVGFTPDADVHDGCNDIHQLCSSGFDFTRFLVFYDARLDKLFFGFDLMDVEEGNVCLGIIGAGVPGDADGDHDPSGNTEICTSFDEEFGIGADEFYMIFVDTNFNEIFSEPYDLRVVYRGNKLRILNGLGVPISGATGDVAIGVAGAGFDPQIPNQNLQSEDIEIAIDDYSTLDVYPRSFAVKVFTGALFDAAAEDRLDEIVVISRE